MIVQKELDRLLEEWKGMKEADRAAIREAEEAEKAGENWVVCYCA